MTIAVLACRVLVGGTALCSIPFGGGCARLLDEKFEVAWRADATPERIIATAAAEFSARKYDTYSVVRGRLHATQSEITPMTIPASVVSIGLFPVFLITWPLMLIVADSQFAAWWPVYPLSIADGTTIHRNFDLITEPSPDRGTLIRIKGKADRRGIDDAQAVVVVLRSAFESTELPSGSTAAPP